MMRNAFLTHFVRRVEQTVCSVFPSDILHPDKGSTIFGEIGEILWSGIAGGNLDDFIQAAVPPVFQLH